LFHSESILVKVGQPLINFAPHLHLIDILLSLYFFFLSLILKRHKNLSPKFDLPESYHDIHSVAVKNLILLVQEILKFDPEVESSL